MTIQLEFTPELIAELRYQRFNHLVPIVQRHMETLLLKAHGLSHEQDEAREGKRVVYSWMRRILC